MEKKSTKIAYFVALGIFIVLLVILGISYKDAPILIEDATTPFAGTFWSLLPPIVAIVLALISKEVYSSLFLGCLVGALLVSNFHPWETVVQLVEGDNGIVTTVSDAGNIAIIVFLVVLGIMVDLMNKTGGSEAFGRWAKKAVKSRAGAQLMTMLLGVLIFIDDYFNCLTVGAVMRPVTESHHISRAKLAYVIDATAAPVCMIAPVSSWAAAVSGYVNSDSVSGIEIPVSVNRTAVEADLAEQFNGKLLGRGVKLAELNSRIYAMPGVENCHITAPAADLAANDTVLPVLGTVTVTEEA